MFDTDSDARAALRNMTLDYESLLPFMGWKLWLADELVAHDILLPSMPSKFNAKYEEWEILFSKVVPLLRSDSTLVGHSLGGIFLAKYLSNHLPKHPYKQLILVAAPYDNESKESLNGFKVDNVASLKNAFERIDLLYSTDDPVVPLDEMNKYIGDIPSAEAYTFTDKQHFNTPTFPELVDIICS